MTQKRFRWRRGTVLLKLKGKMKPFDRNFGKTHLAETPESPGIYRFYNREGELIYVGKAKNLRRRLSQYRNAKRRKKHAKMRQIVAEANRLEHEVCRDEFEALRLETVWIQKHRPKWNVAGAFYFLYPMIGVKIDGGLVDFCYTTLPEEFPELDFHGAFRSRERTRDAFFSLMDLLRLIGHPMPRAKRGIPLVPRGSTYRFSFRQIPREWSARIESFFRGEDFSLIEELAILLLDRPTALARREETQKKLRTIRLFWRHEIQPLRAASQAVGLVNYPVPQRDRDLLFIDLRERRFSIQHRNEETSRLIFCAPKI